MVLTTTDLTRRRPSSLKTNSRAILLGLFIVSATPLCVSARDAQAFAKPGERGCRAIDARGVVHNERHPPGELSPWFKDCIRPIGPDYPYMARVLHQMGSGYFRLQLDLKTGAVMQITTIQSTGFRSLDTAALRALRKWRWKPDKWQQVDIPVTFQLEQHPTIRPGAVRLPKQ